MIVASLADCHDLDKGALKRANPSGQLPCGQRIQRIRQCLRCPAVHNSLQRDNLDENVNQSGLLSLLASSKVARWIPKGIHLASPARPVSG